jgi:hypothetical protein
LIGRHDVVLRLVKSFADNAQVRGLRLKDPAEGRFEVGAPGGTDVSLISSTPREFRSRCLLVELRKHKQLQPIGRQVEITSRRELPEV